MLVIPVIDLGQGQVMHAVEGQRDNYQPIQSQLCQASDADKIVLAILNLYPFNTIYIADLDAINGQGDNSEIIKKIQEDHPTLNIWLDSGISKLEELDTSQSKKIIYVIGTETGIDMSELLSIKNRYPEFILSLDFSGNKFIGDPTILESTDAWPEKIIAMTLNRVGSRIGPDLDRLRKIMANASIKSVYAAGGIRDQDDMQRLEDIGCAGVLIATAIHTLDITSHEIKTMLDKNRI